MEQCLRTGPKEAPLVESATSAAGASEFSQLPAELLESLLQLDLPPAAAEFFWCIYEHHVQSKSVQEASWAAAITRTCALRARVASDILKRKVQKIKANQIVSTAGQWLDW